MARRKQFHLAVATQKLMPKKQKRAARCILKPGAGGFALIIVPSLDLVIYKMCGNNGQYDPTLTKCRSRP